MNYDHSDSSKFNIRYGDVVLPKIDWKEPLKVEIEHFIDCIVTGCAPLAPGPEAMRAVAVVQAIHESIETGQPVDVNI